MMFRIDRASGARFLVMGVEKPSVTHLVHAKIAVELPRVEWQPFIPMADCLGAVEALHPHVPFCTAQADSHKQIPAAMAQRGLQAPAVVASRCPKSTE
jgi:hypothetical protein